MKRISRITGGGSICSNGSSGRCDIYRHFQFSGVPAPTDDDWHWWGKLNVAGYGAVVVLRGSGGLEQRAIHVPWVDPQRRYRVTELFTSVNLGVVNGKELRERGVSIQLSPMGQEILELAAAEPTQ